MRELVLLVDRRTRYGMRYCADAFNGSFWFECLAKHGSCKGINSFELKEADLLVRPAMSRMQGADFGSKLKTIEAGSYGEAGSVVFLFCY